MIPPGDSSGLGWLLLGGCSGSIAPTSSPDFELLLDQEGCPEGYSSSLSYEEGDKVSLPIDDERSIVWECDSYPNSPYCNQYQPNDGNGLGWKMVGHCTGSIAPTASPSFETLVELGYGCPEAYSESVEYESGDLVMVEASIDPSRKVVYECKAMPSGAFCNSGIQFSPGSPNSDLGWKLKGFCNGTMTPTASPAGVDAASACAAIPVYSPVGNYDSGDRVRKGDKIYECRGFPFYLWCSNAFYEPQDLPGLWSQVWKQTGTC
jgi:hypothetical protein